MSNKYLGVDPMLTDVAIAYSNDAYIASEVFPAYAVKKQSGKHFVYDRGRFRVNDNLRNSGSNSNEVTLALTTGSAYFAEDHALKQFVADDDVDNAITPTDPLIDAAENVSEMHLIARETELATMLADTGVMTQNTTLSGTSQWSDYTNSDPVANVRTAMQAIHNAIHVNPNTLILGKQVYDKLLDHPAFIERIKYSALGVMTPELLARIFGVDRVLVGAAGYNSAKEGQTDSMAYIWGKHAILAYINPRTAPKMITLGFTYTWKEMQVERLRGSDEEDRKGTYVRVGNHYYDQKIVAAAAGYLIKNAVA